MQTCGVGDTGEESKLTQLEVACVPGAVLGAAGDPDWSEPLTPVFEGLPAQSHHGSYSNGSAPRHCENPKGQLMSVEELNRSRVSKDAES